MKNQNDLIMYIVCAVILIAGLIVSFTQKREPVKPPDPTPVPLAPAKWDEAATNPVMANGLPKGDGAGAGGGGNAALGGGRGGAGGGGGGATPITSAN